MKWGFGLRRNLLLGVSGALIGGWALPATAADLGGDCCADLEERVAELEATTVRKGNRKINLTISGWIGQQVMWWDDGRQSDMYVGDGGNIFSRFRFTGTAKISPQLTAGFTYEFGANATAIGSMNQLNSGDKLGGSGVGANFPPLAGQPAAYIAAQLRAWQQGTRRNDPLQLMQHVAKQLTPQEIQAVAGWFAAQPLPAKGDAP